MRKRSSEFMTDYVTNQFPIVKFKEMIFAYLNIVELFQVMLNDKDYYIRITPTYELRTSSGKLPTNSKIESFVIKKYDNKANEIRQQLPPGYTLQPYYNQSAFVSNSIHS